MFEHGTDTIPANNYPHFYGNNGGTRFDFLDPVCNANNRNRKEFPITKGGYFEGDANESPYKFRAIYVFNTADPYTQNPRAIYCGTIYHVKNDFEGCDIKRQ
jgi:hypothetical protein